MIKCRYTFYSTLISGYCLRGRFREMSARVFCVRHMRVDVVTKNNSNKLVTNKYTFSNPI